MFKFDFMHRTDVLASISLENYKYDAKMTFHWSVYYLLSFNALILLYLCFTQVKVNFVSSATYMYVQSTKDTHTDKL